MNISDELERILGDMDEDEKRKAEESNTAKQMALLADGGTPTGATKKTPTGANDLIHELRAQMYGADPANTNMPSQQDFATQLMQYLSHIYFPGLVQQGQANVPTAAQGDYADVPSHANGGSIGYHQPGALEDNMLALGGHRALPIIMALHKAAGGSIDLPKFDVGGGVMMDSDPSIPNPSTAPSLAEQIPTGLTQDGVPQLAPITATVKRDQAPWYEGLLGAADVGKTLLGGAMGMVPAALETGARVLGGSPMKAEDIYAQALGHYTPDLLTQRGKEMGGDLMSFMERNKIPLAIPELMPFEEALGSGAGAAMRKSDEALKAVQPAHGELGSNLGNVFYSALDNAAQGIKRGAGTGAEFLQELMGKGGIKKAEIEDRGLDALANAGKMTKQQFEQELNARSAPQIQEQILKHSEPYEDEVYEIANSIYNNSQGQGIGRRTSWNDAVQTARERIAEREELNQPQYSDYTLPGGDNYQEMLLHLPKDRMNAENNFNSSHYSVPNILTHMRMKDRVGPNGEKLLNLEELQSDWHQQGRDKGYANQNPLPNLSADELLYQQRANLSQRQKEYLAKYIAKWDQAENEGNSATLDSLINEYQNFINTEKLKGIPNAPFKKNWDEMALKRLIHHAAENGYDGIAVTPGDVQANRYNLEKFIGSIRYQPSHKLLEAFNPEGTPVLSKVAEPHELSDYIGKDVADRLIKTEPVQGVHKLSGLDLRSGGEGMKGFYDVKVPTLLNNIGKKYGVKTGEINSDVGEYKVMKDSGSLPFRLESKHSPDLISRHATADDAWNEAEKLGTQKFHYFPITPEMKKDVLSNGLPMYRDGGLVQI